MRKKVLSCALSTVLAIGCVPAAGFAEVGSPDASNGDVTLASLAVGSTFTVDDITYTVTSETEVSVGAQSTAGTSFASTLDAVVIPSQVNGYTVTGINAYAFSNGGNEAASLSSVTLPNTLKSIGNFAFDGCANLKEVTIPASVTSMGMYCFANCTALATLTFADCDADGEKLVMDEGVFFVSSAKTGALQSVTLPKRLANVPSKAFQHQTSMTSVKYAPGTTLTRIGSYAFYQCASLEYLEIPTLTAKKISIDGNWGINSTSFTYSADVRAFTECSKLSEIVFLGDETEDYGLDTSEFNIRQTPNVVSYVTYYYPPVKTVVYYGNHYHEIFVGGSAGTANHYQRISYFANETDAAAGTNAVGEVFVRDDVALKDLDLAAGKTDDKGALVYRGSVPEAPEGMIWYYGSDSLEEGATHYLSAYPVAENDLSYGQVVMDQSDFTYTSNPVNISAKVLDASGRTIQEGDYTLSVKDEAGADVALSEVKEAGTYTLTATAKEGGSFKGSVSTEFTIKIPTCTVTRSSGNAQYSTLNHETDSAFASDAVDTVILVGRSSLAAGAAAAGLAGVRQAPIMVTDDGALTVEATRTLNYYKPKSVMLVGITDSETVKAAIQSTLGSTVTITNAFTADTQALTSYNLYNRTKSAEYWSSTDTVYIASSEDVTGAALAGSYAYRTKSPVFLTDESGVLPSSSITAIAGDGFANVVFVGDAASQSKSVTAALTAAGYAGTTRSLTADNAYELSATVAKDEATAQVCSYDNVTLVSPADEESAVIASATCGQNKAPLLYADDEEGGDVAVDEIVKPNTLGITKAYVFGVHGYISGEFQNAFERLWGMADGSDLKWATASVAVTETDEGVTPVVAVTDLEGKTLTEGTDFVVNYVNNATDRRILVKNLTGGDYTALITGTGSYTGSNYVSFSIEEEPVITNKTVYRLYNKTTSEHLFTSSYGEYQALATCGWTQEGAAFETPTQSEKGVYRLYNPALGEMGKMCHHYTLSQTERDTLVTNAGWQAEGTAFYAYKVTKN